MSDIDAEVHDAFDPPLWALRALGADPMLVVGPSADSAAYVATLAVGTHPARRRIEVVTDPLSSSPWFLVVYEILGALGPLGSAVVGLVDLAGNDKPFRAEMVGGEYDGLKLELDPAYWFAAPDVWACLRGAPTYGVLLRSLRESQVLDLPRYERRHVDPASLYWRYEFVRGAAPGRGR